MLCAGSPYTNRSPVEAVPPSLTVTTSLTAESSGLLQFDDVTRTVQVALGTGLGAVTSVKVIVPVGQVAGTPMADPAISQNATLPTLPDDVADNPLQISTDPSIRHKIAPRRFRISPPTSGAA